MIVTCTVVTELPDGLDDDPCVVLASIVGQALSDSDIPALRIEATKGSHDQVWLDLEFLERVIVTKAVEAALAKQSSVRGDGDE